VGLPTELPKSPARFFLGGGGGRDYIEETDREGSGKGKRYDGVIGSYGPFRRFEQI
jgi:hypothetical protein